VCAAGFQGLTCADDIDECAANPCVHGTCNDQIAGYTCACQAGYGGANCDIDIDDCANVTCSGHGTCTDGVDSHTCVCDGFYTGADCQIAPCGNGLVQGAEQCDDGNTVNGDGCSSTCTLEGCPAGTVDPPASTVVADAGDRTAPAGYEYRGLAGQATAAATAECPDWSCGVGQGAAAGAIDDSRATMWNNGYWDVGAPIKLTITFLAPKTFYGLHIIAEAAPQDDETYSVIATKSDGSHVTIGPRTATIVDWRTVPAPTYTGADVGFGGTYSDITSIEITVTAPYVDPSVSSWIGIREVQLIQPAGCVSVCPAGGTFAAGKCYKFVAALASQPDALAACRLLPGGDLASAHSTEENRFLGTIIDPNGDGNGVGGLTAWIGGISPHGFNCPAEAQHGAAGIFNWTDGSAWNYNAWRTVTNEPDACPGVPVCTQLFPDNNFFHNNICGFGQTANGQSGCSGWNDVPCSLAMGYICQFNPN
jgi:cysteine-rich repeat protein